MAVLNMDAVPEAGWLEPLVAVAAHPGVGAVNPLLLLADGVRVNAAGQIVHVTGLGFNRGLGEPASAYAGVEPFRVNGIQDAAFLMRTSVLRDIGGMDASGFLYHEDVNVSWPLSAVATTEILGWGYAFVRGLSYMRAKLRAYPWSAEHRRTIASRRALAREIRRRSPWLVLARMNWRYEWRQFATLLAERGSPRREPPSGYVTRGKQ